MRKFLILGAAAIAATVALASPAAAQWYPRGYGNGYEHEGRYGYGPAARINPDYAVNRCARSVARRGGRILDITQVRPTRAHLRVRGIASTGSRYGYGRAHLRFTCDVGHRGQVDNLTFDRRYY